VKRRVERRRRWIRTTVASVVPGFGLVALRRVFGPIFLLLILALVVEHVRGIGPPFAFQPRVGDPPLGLGPFAFGVCVVVYLISITGYIGRAARADAAVDAPPAPKNRPATPTRLPAEAA
jgi:hypothetical protein